MNNKIIVIISSEDSRKAQTGAMYAVNALRNNWMEDVKLFFFGPSESLLLKDEYLQQIVEEFNALNQKPIACKFISESEKNVEGLTRLGLSVEYVGEPISKYIKQGYVPMIW